MTPMFAIHRTTASDSRLVPLIAALDADLRGRYGEAQAGYAPMNLIADGSPFVIALDAEGAPVGCGTFRPFDATSVEVKRMFVAPAARRRGLAAQILAAVEAWAREQGFATAILETGIHQHEAHRALPPSGLHRHRAVRKLRRHATQPVHAQDAVATRAPAPTL